MAKTSDVELLKQLYLKLNKLVLEVPSDYNGIRTSLISAKQYIRTELATLLVDRELDD